MHKIQTEILQSYKVEANIYMYDRWYGCIWERSLSLIFLFVNVGKGIVM